MKKIFYILLPFLAACSNLPFYGSIAEPVVKTTVDRQIRITTWNIGYGALGANADFIADGGKHLRALPKPAIQEASRDIAATARNLGSDILLFQEMAQAGFMTRGVPLFTTVEAALPQYTSLYWPNLEFSEPPDPLSMSHGMGFFVKNAESSIQAVELPQSNKAIFLGIKQYYGALVGRFPVKNSNHEWIIINIHLSAFDAHAALRYKQAEAVLSLAAAEYAKGNYVVIGGDWNMRLTDTRFENTTAPKYTGWLVDVPREFLPEGWKIAADPAIPTVRTLQKPYIPGENYTAVIDGFITSPNVVTAHVETLDTGFRYTDHQPVTAVFKAR